MPSIAKKSLLRKLHLLNSFQKSKLTQTSGLVFADRFEQIKMTNFELELLKILHCFLDGHGKFICNLVFLKRKYF